MGCVGFEHGDDGVVVVVLLHRQIGWVRGWCEGSGSERSLLARVVFDLWGLLRVTTER